MLQRCATSSASQPPRVPPLAAACLAVAHRLVIGWSSVRRGWLGLLMVPHCGVLVVMLVTQHHRGIRMDDLAGGKMVGAGRHLTTRGTFEPYKLEKVKGTNKKRKRETLQQGADTMASRLAKCGPAFSFFRGVPLLSAP